MADQQETKRVKEMIGTLGEIVTVAEPEQRVFDGTPVPLVIRCTESSPVTTEQTCQWIKDNQALLEEKLKKHGAILFRGFPLEHANSFDSFVSSFER